MAQAQVNKDNQKRVRWAPGTQDGVQTRDMVQTKKRRRRRFSSSWRPFVITVLLVGAIVGLAVVRDWRGAAGGGGEEVARFSRRSAGGMSARGGPEGDQDVAGDCHLVHNPNITDKCAFVTAHCADEDAGLIDYLEIYYCKASKHTQPLVMIFMVIWLGLLFTTIGAAASDFFCVNLSTIANMWHLSDNVAGVTLLAFGNGSPDVFSTYAAMSSNSGSLAVGELIGAACFITAVVAGAMALSRPFEVIPKPFMRDLAFFIVAAGFSMSFLWDGKLHVWECVTMVLFYFFYVIFVVLWHWWGTRKHRKHTLDVVGRSHFVTEGGEEAEVPYRDDPEMAGPGRPKLSRGPSEADFLNLQRANNDWTEPDKEEQERMQEAGAAVMNQRMKLGRPSMRSRRTTAAYMRPSLIGALEFNAFNDKLRKARNIHDIPIGQVPERRWSHDPLHQHAVHGSVSSISSAANPAPTISHLSAVQPDRARAVSVNDMDGYNRGGAALEPRPQLLVTHPSNEASTNTLQVPTEMGDSLVVPEVAVGTPSIEVTPPVSRSHSPAPKRREELSLTAQLPKLTIPPSTATTTPGTARTPGSTSPFPVYQDYFTHSPRPPSSIPAPSMDAASIFSNEFPFPQAGQAEKPWRWWPYSVLPKPGIIFATLFPTLATWHDKSMFQKIMAVVTAPSIFLLTLTLPVVDVDKEENEEEEEPDVQSKHIPTVSVTAEDDDAVRQSPRDLSTPFEPYRDDPTTTTTTQHSRVSSYDSSHHAPSLSTHDHHIHPSHAQPPLISPLHPPIIHSPHQIPIDTVQRKPEPLNWNRWLVTLHLFTSPLLLILVGWTSFFGSENPRTLLRWTLGSLALSLLFLLLLLLRTTTPTRIPPWRPYLSYIGFLVAIAWISTVANEVVGVLKALGVIIDMSDAILGLTIFAVGNSIGDLVADITVAKAGYPIMALSACFGGPMLNILLGVGFSGGFLSFSNAVKRRHEHPGHGHKHHGLKFKPYILDISTTLVISGMTLLVTLIVLFVAVPLNKWRMDRKIGVLLIGIWTLATFGNVLGEYAGWHDDIADAGRGWLGRGE